MSSGGSTDTSLTSTNFALYNVPKLLDNGSNWLTYRERVLTAVGSRGLKRYLEGRAKIPTPLVSINTGTNDAPVFVQSLDNKTPATEDEIEEAEKKLDEYEQKECAVKQTLYGSISDRRLIEIKNLGTAAEAWAKLCALHENKSEIVAVDKRGQLQSLRMQDGADIRKHLAQLEHLREELSGLGAPVNDSDFSAMMLSSLPQSYRPMVQTMLAVARQSSVKLTPDLIVAHLTADAEYQESLNQRSAHTGGNNALSATTGGKKPKRGGKQESAAASSDSKNCFNCGKAGHWEKDCWRPGGGKEGQGPKQQAKKGKSKGKSETANTATTAPPTAEVAFACTSDFVDVANAMNIPKDRRGALIDCGASRHFSPARTYFVTFRTITPRDIHTADGRPVQAIGEGDMIIELPNGSESTKVRLKDVLYAPHMAFTLISVSIMDKAGMAILAQGEMCKIITAPPESKIIARIPLSQGLYRVSGLSLPDTLNACT